MKDNKNKKFGITAVIASLIIGIAIGACGSYIFGSRRSVSTDHIIQESKETENKDIKNTDSDMIRESSENGMNGNFSVDDEEALTINGVRIFLSEINARVYMARDEYVAQYGEEPWGMMLENGMTVAAYAKNTMLDEIERVTILAEQAEVYGVEALTEEEMTQCSRRTEDYMAALGSSVAAQFSVEYGAVQTIYEKDALAMKVYNRILEDLSASLREQDAYSSMEDSEFESVLQAEFEQLYSQWKDEAVVETTENWNQLVIGAMG